MKRTLTNRSSTGAQATVIREMFADADKTRRNAPANASGGQGNSEIDKLRAVNAELLAACKMIAANHARAGCAISEAQLDWVRAALARATGAV